MHTAEKACIILRILFILRSRSTLVILLASMDISTLGEYAYTRTPAIPTRVLLLY